MRPHCHPFRRRRPRDASTVPSAHERRIRTATRGEMPDFFQKYWLREAGATIAVAVVVVVVVVAVAAAAVVDIDVDVAVMRAVADVCVGVPPDETRPPNDTRTR
jgi:hypothetical protein